MSAVLFSSPVSLHPPCEAKKEHHEDWKSVYTPPPERPDGFFFACQQARG